MKNFSVIRKRLPGGLRTLLLPRQEGQTVTLLVLIGVGSRYETPRQWGLSHFLEHMFFKGTTTRPTTKEIAEAIDNVGGEFNAFTSEEYTGYYVKVASQHLQRGAEVVSDILLRPLFPPEEIERERGVIIEEIRMYTDSPMSRVQHLWHTALYGAHPLGRRIDGQPQTVSKFVRSDFQRYTSQHYHTRNAVVTVAGKFNVRQTERLLAHLFAPLSRGRETHPKPAPPRVPRHRLVTEYRGSLDQTHMVVGVPGVSLSDDRRWAASLLSIILGGGMSSRMFLSVRERHGLAYAIKTSADEYTDSGSLATQAGVRTDQALKALRLILREYDRAMETAPPKEELAKAKQMLLGRLVIELEETNSLAAFAGAQELLQKRVMSPQAMWRRITAVSPADVQAVARDLLRADKRALALLGPHRSKRAFERVLTSA